MDEQQRLLQLFTSFRKVHQTFYQTLMKAAQRFGITPIQYLVLKHLADRPQTGLAELADSIQLGSSTASGIVNRMVKADLVVSERPESDRRSVALSLTDRGRTLWTQIHELRMDFLKPLSLISEEDQKHLIRIHDDVVQILQRVREKENEHE